MLAPLLHAEVLDRFLRYVQFDTRSVDDQPQVPSTAGQWDLAHAVAHELRAIGLTDVVVTDHCYVLATLPATPGCSAPTIGFLAHLDTSPEAPGGPVRPRVVHGYRGGDLHISDDPAIVVPAAELADYHGHDLVTSDGTTLLGADDKAGIAAIVTAVHYLIDHPEIAHGTVRIALTPDEEVGRGVDFLDLAAFGADVAYTLDGGRAGELETETFSADLAIVSFRGVNCHPGQAKGKMVNAIDLAVRFLTRLPAELGRPQTTDGRDGFIHPYALSGSVETATIKILLRDFEEAGLANRAAALQETLDALLAEEPRAQGELTVKRQYRNMRAGIEQNPAVVEVAVAAMRAEGIEPIFQAIRGGTDGARLTELGLPCPNLFAGQHRIHGRSEWASVNEMAQAAAVVVQLVRHWAEHPRSREVMARDAASADVASVRSPSTEPHVAPGRSSG